MAGAINGTPAGIADYVFVRVLGDGNHGTYHLARPPARLSLDSEFVVVKVLAGQTTADTFRRATRELKAFAAVRSPYLVRLFDAGQQGGTFFYAMEWLPRGSLASPSEPVSRSDATARSASAARAAHDLHEAGIVHRDVNPDNVLLADDGGRLADLGLAQVLQPGVAVTGIGRVESVEYIDPVVLGGGQPSRLTDVYGLGMTLHRALTGSGMFGDIPADQPMMAMRAVLSRSPEPAEGLTPEERELIEACVSGDFAQRPRTALDVADRIEALLAANGAPVSHA